MNGLTATNSSNARVLTNTGHLRDHLCRPDVDANWLRIICRHFRDATAGNRVHLQFNQCVCVRPLRGARHSLPFESNGYRPGKTEQYANHNNHAAQPE